MRFAYADPPYLGCCGYYGHNHDTAWLPPEMQAASIEWCWDKAETHASLISRLDAGYPDGWALSCSTPSLRDLLPRCPPDVRIAAWVKPFAAYKRNIRVAYTWEPVILRGGRVSSTTGAPVTRDHLAEPITLRRGFTGAKPDRFCDWVLSMLGFIPGDRVDDLFPGTGVMGRAVELAQQMLIAEVAS